MLLVANPLLGTWLTTINVYICGPFLLWREPVRRKEMKLSFSSFKKSMYPTDPAILTFSRTRVYLWKGKLTHFQYLTLIITLRSIFTQCPYIMILISLHARLKHGVNWNNLWYLNQSTTFHLYLSPTGREIFEIMCLTDGKQWAKRCNLSYLKICGFKIEICRALFLSQSVDQFSTTITHYWRNRYFRGGTPPF